MTSTAQRFNKFLENIELTNDQKTKGIERRESVVQKLNQKYYGSSSTTQNSKFVGSWGKYTHIRPPRDVDVLFELPADVYSRFELRAGNKQSQLLQEIRDHLLNHYPSTKIRGDGPVVLVPFSDYNTEIIPAFKLNSGRYYICFTKDGGRYKEADYDQEITDVSNSNTVTKNNTRDLIRMMKCWQGFCGIPIRSFYLEILAINFLKTWQYSGQSSVYYDWIIRDFLQFMLNKKGVYISAPGTGEIMNLGDAWASKTETAYKRAVKACEDEANSLFILASLEWQKIFGYDFPS